ncbi:MAG: hypothetical protein OEV51_04010 [Nitrospira sp.]|nr:hypothetical protein [Nitrospira sp.]
MKRDVVIAALPRNTTRRVVKLSAKPSASPLSDLKWRLERLESQMQKLSELVRDHAEDMDRLVRIVAENSDILRRQLLRKHHEKVRVRKHLRATDAAIE